MENRFNFTKEALQSLALPEPGKRNVYHDAKTTGLQIRVTANGAKTFSVYRRIKGGRPERVTLGQFPTMTIEQARKLAARVNAEIEEGSNPAEVKRAHRDEQTFGEVFDQFIKEKKNKRGKPLSAKTKRDYQDCLRIHLPRFKNLKLSQISNDDMRRAHLAITKKSAASANRALAMVSSVFNFALNELRVFKGENPSAGIKKNFEADRDRFASADELRRLLASMSADTMGDFFLLALLTGARRSNVQEMKWSELDFDSQTWKLETTKNGESQTITLSPEAVAVLAGRKENADKDAVFVFPGAGKTGHLVEPKGAWMRIFDRDELSQLQHIIKEADGPEIQDGKTMQAQLRAARRQAEIMGLDASGTRIPALRIHDLRRTLGSWQAKSGASLAIIGKSLNHKSQQSTAIYARLDLDPVRSSVNRATAAMLATASGNTGANVVGIRKAAK